MPRDYCQEHLDVETVDYSTFTKRRLYSIATDDKVRMSKRYAATRELQNRRRVKVEGANKLAGSTEIKIRTI